MSTENGEITTPATLTLQDLKPKMELRGKVKKVDLSGAFVDIGVGVDGLLHISQISTEPIKNVSDVLKEDEEVTVWVQNVDVEKGRFSVTMIRPLGLGWNEIRDGLVVTGKVVRVERFGAFVDIGAERPGMIHVSELASGYVNSPEEVVKVGEEIEVKVIKVNRKKKQIDLSRKALQEPVVIPQDLDEDDGEIPTVMELALRQAMQGTELGEQMAAERKQNKAKREKKVVDPNKKRQQDEIIQRTLKNRVK